MMLMSASQSRNLPERLEQVEAMYRDPAAQLPPVTAEMLAERARHFASAVRFSLDEPGAIWRLHEATADLRDVSSLRILLPGCLDGALALMGADSGTVQLLDPVTSLLPIVTQSGFTAGFPGYFAAVEDGSSVFGRAARERAQTVIADIDAGAGFAPYRGIAAASGFRAVQSTPMIDHSGRLVGMISTNFRRPHRPASRDLRIMELYADFAGQAVAGHLGALDGNDLGDQIGQAVISALLDPGGGWGSRERGPAPAAFSEDEASQFAEYVVTRLFAVGLSLESARSIVGQGPAGDRIAAATGEVDRMIGNIRAIMFSRAAARRNHSPARWPLPPSDRTGKLLGSVVKSIFNVGLLLQAAAGLPQDAARLRIFEALRLLEDLTWEVRDHVFAERGQGTQPGPARRSLGSHERPAPPADREALQQRMARTTRTLQAAAADYATLLEQQAHLARQPERMDYPTEIKRWRAFARQAEQMAKRWEQPPGPEAPSAGQQDAEE